MSEEIEYRTFEVRASEDTESRTIEGLAVPYGQVADIGTYQERFERGAFAGAESAPLFWNHDHRGGPSAAPIGKVFEIRDGEDGLHVKARISQTPKGDEIYTLLRDGVLQKFSIGFSPVESKRDGDVVVRTKALLREVSVVANPAYAGAAVAAVRSETITQEDTSMDDTMSAEVSDLREAVADLEREVRSAFHREPEVTTPQYRCVGEWVKAAVTGDEDAIRAYTGATTSNSIVQDAWIGDLTRLVDQAAILRSVFATGPLPSEGLNIEFGKLSSNSMAVSAQGAEGSDLVYGEVQLTTATAPVKTFGGYTSLTRQVIERSSVNYLNTALRAQAIAAGVRLNTEFRAFYLNTVSANSANAVTVANGDNYVDWVAAVVDAAAYMASQGLGIDALVTDKSVFKRLIGLKGGDGRPMMVVSGTGSNTVGTLSAKGLSGDLVSVRVVCDPLLTSAHAAFVNSDAIRSYNSPLVRLQDDNIINLTRDFSVYFYSALADEIPTGVVPVTITA